MAWPMLMGLLGKVGMGAGAAGATGASVAPGVAGTMSGGLGGGTVAGPMSIPGMSTTASSVAPQGLFGRLGIDKESVKAIAGAPGQRQQPSGLLAGGLAASKPQDLSHLQKLSKQPEKPQLQRRLPRNSYLSGLLGR